MTAIKFDIDFELVSKLADWMSEHTDTPTKAAVHAMAFTGQVMGFTARDEDTLKEGLELVEAMMRMIAFKALEFKSGKEWQDHQGTRQ